MKDAWRVRREVAGEKSRQATDHRKDLQEAVLEEHERRTRPVTYEMTSAIQRIHEALPAGATKTVVERLRRPMRLGTQAVDFFGRTYDRLTMGIVLYALRGPALFAIGTPDRDQVRAAVNQIGMEFRRIRGGRPLVVMGYQPRLEVLPVAIAAAMLPHFRRWQARQAAINLEAFAKSRAGQAVVGKVDAMVGDRVDRVIHRFESLLPYPKRSDGSKTVVLETTLSPVSVPPEPMSASHDEAGRM
ncbi:hypothetical protein HY087_02130 [Candidatus Gottesmanbacteria bacterium]|nr:hypothetical protein [Candidatus Gottesmanbacteria bacterium]